MKLLFICSANCGRSAMAESYFRHLLKQNKLTDEVCCDSAGIAVPEEPSVPEEAQELMTALGLTLENHLPKQVTAELIDSSDHIIGMTADHIDFIHSNFPQSKDKIRTILSLLGRSEDLADPKRGDLETFQNCFLSMMPALAELADRIMRSKQ